MPNGIIIRQVKELLRLSYCELMLIYNLVEKGAQFIVASHSPILLGIPGASILSFDDGSVKEIPYEETESYKITKLFINNKELMLNNLLKS